MQRVDAKAWRSSETPDFQRTFRYFTGELATSLFNMPYRNTLLNSCIQAAVAPACRLLTTADDWSLKRTRYAVAVQAQRTT